MFRCVLLVNFAIFAKIITFAKHENRENLILRNSRKFRETREYLREFRVSRKSWKEFRQKPLLRCFCGRLVTPIWNSLRLGSSNSDVTFEKRVTRYCNGTVTYKFRYWSSSNSLHCLLERRYFVTFFSTAKTRKVEASVTRTPKHEERCLLAPQRILKRSVRFRWN